MFPWNNSFFKLVKLLFQEMADIHDSPTKRRTRTIEQEDHPDVSANFDSNKKSDKDESNAKISNNVIMPEKPTAATGI